MTKYSDEARISSIYLLLLRSVAIDLHLQKAADYLDARFAEQGITDEINSDVPLSFFIRVIFSLLTEHPHPEWGLKFGSKLSLNMEKRLGDIFFYAPSFKEAGIVFEKYVESVIPLAAFECEESQGHMVWRLRLRTNYTNEINDFLNGISIAAANRFASLFTNTNDNIAIFKTTTKKGNFDRTVNKYSNAVVEYETPCVEAHFIKGISSLPSPYANDYFFQLTEKLFDHFQDESSRNKTLIGAIESRIRAKPEANWTLDAMAVELGLSVSTFRRRMKDDKLKLQEIVKSIRVAKAKEMLDDSKLRLTDISDCLGFNNLSNFTTMFKNSVGITPSEYRKSKQQAGD